jgi:hypothetical protein
MERNEMKDKVNDAVDTARPYVERLATDEELHDHVKSAYASARKIYDDLIGPSSMTGFARRVASDTDVQDELRKAVDELREASRRARGESQSHGARNFTLLVTGIALGVLFNPISGPETRRWLKDKLFGPDTSFEFDPSPSDN